MATQYMLYSKSGWQQGKRLRVFFVKSGTATIRPDHVLPVLLGREQKLREHPLASRWFDRVVLVPTRDYLERELLFLAYSGFYLAPDRLGSGELKSNHCLVLVPTKHGKQLGKRKWQQVVFNQLKNKVGRNLANFVFVW